MTLNEINKKVRSILAQNSPGIGPDDVIMTVDIKDTYYSVETKSVYVNRICRAFDFVDCTEFSNKTFDNLKNGQKVVNYINATQNS